MAKYPTLKEFQNKPLKGIQRCDELLKKSPNDAQLLIVKLQLQCLIPSIDTANQTLSTLLALKPGVLSPQDVMTIEQSVVGLQRDVYPPPTTAGAEVAKLWESTAKIAANTNQKIGIYSSCFSRAMKDLRLRDAQQSVILLKALTPKDRTVYMAHLVLTQLLSQSNDDLHARLALSLARKAVKDNFDDDKQLDCRTVGQIFALQHSTHDLDGIQGRRFADSKQVFRAQHQRNEKQHPEHAQSNGDHSPLDLEQLSSRQWLSTVASSLQQQLDQICNASSCNEQDLRSFTSSAIRAFVLAVKHLKLHSSRAAAQMIFLAISALVRLWTIHHTTAYLLQAAFLAETLLSYQPRVHEAKVFLTYVYSKLGLISLAAKQWDELAIKEIQLDTVGHIFMTRLSISHPHAFKPKTIQELDPQRILSNALSMYRRVEGRLAETQADVLNHGQTGMILDLHDMRETLRKSVTRRIISLEQRRLARLRGKALDEQYVQIRPQQVAAWCDLTDTRDFAATSDEITERAVYGHGTLKPWILYGLAADAAWSLMHNASPAVKDTANLLAELDRIQDNGFASDGDVVAGTLAHLILQSVYDLGGTNEHDTQLQVAAYIDAIDELQCDLLASDTQLLPLRVSTVSLYLDALCLVTAFSKFAEARKAFTKEQGLDLRRAVDQATTSLQTYASSQASALGTADVDRMIRQEDSNTWLAGITGILGKDHLTTFTTNVVESARDAWLGPASIKA